MRTSIKYCFRAILAGCLLASVAFAQQNARPASRPQAASSTPRKAAPKKRRESPEAAKQRAEALRAIAEKLNIGAGGTIADIGAGGGRDSWVFAQIVGPQGRVYSEEISQPLVDKLKQQVEQQKVSQVHPILGKPDSACLPEEAVELEYMHYVYHHFAQPQAMLESLWRGLKPGGYLVIADRHRGTLQDWVPREDRGKKHYWIAETTVVRDAREAGFSFVDCAEDCWPADDQFVLIFQRPRDATEPGTDPDLPLPLDVQMVRQRLLPKAGTVQRPVFIALGEARTLIGPILAQSTGTGLDVVLEEWATAKDERPASPANVSLPSVLTENGDVQLGDELAGAVFFLDTYHLMFHHEKTLTKLHEGLASDGFVAILDRKAEPGLSRRLASHRRKIPVQTVKQEMAAAGFQLLSEEPAPASDRFLLVFGKGEDDRQAE